MSDLISRADAIRIASGYCHSANIAKELAKLPSAQPEIIRCNECKFSDEFEGDLWLCRRCKESFRVSAIDTCNISERRKDNE